MRGHLASRRNAAGLGAALLGPVLHLAGVLDGAVWPLVSVGLYAAVALVVPPDPPPRIGADPLVDVLRHQVRELRRGLRGRPGLPPGVPAAVARILDALGRVLDRLERIADDPADQVAMPQRLARADTLLRHDLPECLAVYRERGPRARGAAAALVEQLGVIAGAVDALAAEVPESGAARAAELTRELRRRYAP